jgi:hypothetical protein
MKSRPAGPESKSNNANQSWFRTSERRTPFRPPGNHSPAPEDREMQPLAVVLHWNLRFFIFYNLQNVCVSMEHVKLAHCSLMSIPYSTLKVGKYVVRFPTVKEPLHMARQKKIAATVSRSHVSGWFGLRSPAMSVD